VTPPSPLHHVEIIERMKLDPGDQNAFLNIQRLKLINHYQDGTSSAEYYYDAVVRKWIDAVVLVLTAEIDGALSVCLRSCIRPPLILRQELVLPMEDDRPSNVLWEVPAGLIEENDTGIEGILKRAATEALEETGYTISRDDFSLMPGAPFLSPGVLPERIYFARAGIADVDARSKPTGDGSPVEDGGVIWWVSVKNGLTLCEQGVIADTKTELALRRLAAQTK
jgi:8-oxo-dGTP pyrophosphatase MutT (NUDIX family)